MKKKPIREWLETIADPTIREAAISQIDENWYHWPKNGMVKRLADALFHFNDWEATKEGYVCWDEIQNLALKGQLETREVEAPEMKKGYIPYSTEQEREWAIAQAERMGAKLYPENEICRQKDDNCIRIFNDGECMDYDTKKFLRPLSLFPLERLEKEMQLEKQTYWSTDSEKKGFTYDVDKFNSTEQEDGTIILKPKKKKVKVWIATQEPLQLASWAI